MGIGHASSPKQQSLFTTKWRHRLSHGGRLRNHRDGRGQRPLSTKEPIHLVFKVYRSKLRHNSLRHSQSYLVIHRVITKYSVHFGVRVDQVSIQADHIHMLIRARRRSQFHHFFRVVAGQVSQRFKHDGMLKTASSTISTKPTHTSLRQQDLSAMTDTPEIAQSAGSLWKHRPFSRVVRGFRAFIIVRNYIQLNEQEAAGRIRYQKLRLRGLSMSDWEELWN